MHPQSTCSIPACGKPQRARGWCLAHYARWRRHGNPLAGKPAYNQPIAERFWSHVNKDGPIPEHRPDLGQCWEWTGARTVMNGEYGVIRIEGSMVRAHRWLYEQVHGPIPDGFEPDHLCRNTACVNDSHLEPVTHQENMRRGQGAPAMNRAKTHCPQGHPYDIFNTYYSPSGRRHCRACQKVRKHQAMALL